jgi:hypothetical protein
MSLKIKNEWFIDKEGSKVLLRGINLGGDSKVPVVPNGATHIKTDFKNYKDVSFIGRPFPLKEANEHFRRIENWGFNCIRFLITWEAIEHQGPKKYDKEYLDYIEEVIKIAENYDFYIFIDPHQDVWSRMTGGDGAPGWTFEKVGLDFTKFDITDAALVMQYRYDPNDVNKYPDMHWHSNLNRFANCTMWTLFFGGKDFAPSCKVNGENIQDYLQNHYIEAIKQLAIRIKDIPYVIGYDTFNEPDQGWIEKYVDGSNIGKKSTELGVSFSPIDAMLTGSGLTRKVGFREIKRFGIKETRKIEINKDRISCWFKEKDDIWKNEGVWGLGNNGQPFILDNNYFIFRNGKKIDFHFDYLSPFIIKYSQEIRRIVPDVMIFFEGNALRMIAGEDLSFNVLENSIHAAHWYDSGTWASKRPMIRINYNIQTNKLVFGTRNVQKMFNQQLASIKSKSKNNAGVIPTLIGEFGLCYDLNKKSAYKTMIKNPKKAWKKHIKLLNMYYNAMDRLLLNSTQWVYSAANCNEWGDLWNLEDYSIFSKDQQLDSDDINSGGRAIEGFCRPHYVKCAGIPLKMEFNLKKKRFCFEFNGTTSIQAPTIVYIPKMQYPNGFNINLSNGEFEIKPEKQLIYIYMKEKGLCSVIINPK